MNEKSSRNIISPIKENHLDSVEKINLKENKNKINDPKTEDASNIVFNDEFEDTCKKLKNNEYKNIFEENFIKGVINNIETKKIKFKIVNDKVKEQRVIKENDDEEKKGKEEKDNEDTINLIKIYIDLYTLYQEIVTNNLLSKNFQEFTNKINDYPIKNYIFENFDNFCKVLRINLYSKMGNKFSEIFFRIWNLKF